VDLHLHRVHFLVIIIIITSYLRQKAAQTLENAVYNETANIKMFIKYKVTKYGGTLICVNHELSMYNAISKETYCAKLVTRPDQTTQAAVGKVKFTILHWLS